ncbi:zinc finger protein on ecdysone puffs isoform X2 [Zerene cesonia]|uniref:zinc finger protein on ecdysone puffs isoform X2 n=1 Tax=Zerene cesonia TaxID=33412 RepID=UPI0018E53D99|nr:zinc finger protein on ecdysone puffs isoform X2 [Zerene cesonia]
MANRRPPQGRRMDFSRNDRGKSFRPGVSPWQGGTPGSDIPNLLPLAGGSTEATLALASNIINLLQPRQTPVPSLLDMPIRRDFGPSMGRYDRGYGPNRMGNQNNFRRSGNYNRAGERINSNRKPFRPHDGQRQQNKSSPKKEADSKSKSKESEQDKKDSDSTEKTENKQDDKKEPQKTRYDDINPQLLKCHICNKSMWDGRSFENHLSGRAHAIMMQKTAESYALTADTMRQEFKIREMKRTRKSGQQQVRDFYCAMCDMYAADGSAHRTTVGHRKLKKYLHPTCTSCHKEMPTRIELDEHRLTPEHLSMMQDKQEVVGKPKPEVMVISTLHTEQLYLRDDRQRFKRQGEEKEREKREKEGEQNKEGAEKESEGADEPKEGEGEKEKVDKDDTIIDFKEGDDLTNITSDRFPEYSTERGVGRSFLTDFSCVQCALCRKLLDTRETAELHLRTWRHHQLFVRMLQERSGKEIQAQESAKRPHGGEESGNWKRRKASPELDEDDRAENGHEPAAEAGPVKEEKQVEEKKDGAEGEMPAADELEDWEQSVDEILRDVKAEAIESEQQEQLQPKVEQKTPEKKQDEQENAQENTQESKEQHSGAAENKVVNNAKNSPLSSPRGRGRGRPRRY